MSEKADKTPGQVTEAIVKRLYDEGAHNWTIQEKGVLLAAIKLTLRGQKENA
jgi:hypothetical protein